MKRIPIYKCRRCGEDIEIKEYDGMSEEHLKKLNPFHDCWGFGTYHCMGDFIGYSIEKEDEKV